MAGQKNTRLRRRKATRQDISHLTSLSDTYFSLSLLFPSNRLRNADTKSSLPKSMRSRAATRRVTELCKKSGLHRPVDLLPHHHCEGNSKKDDDGHIRGKSRQKLVDAFWRYFFRLSRYKAENLVNLCGGDVFVFSWQHRRFTAQCGVTFQVVICLVVLAWMISRFQSAPYRGRRFPLVVRVEGARMTQILSASRNPLNFPILIQAVDQHPSAFRHPPSLSTIELNNGKFVDYDGLTIMFMDENVSRVIYHNYWLDEGEVHDRFVRDDDIDNYYAFDDDHVRDVTVTYDDDEMKEDRYCRRVPWQRNLYHNCNTFHEMNAAVNVPTYLSHGAYREVFIHKNEFLSQEENVIWKQLRYYREYTVDQFEYVHMDALVMERLTSNDRIVTPYGHCALSILTEYFVNGDLEQLALVGTGYFSKVNRTDSVGNTILPDNGLTPRNKLEISLELAEALAALHLYPGGRIVHNDLQAAQFLIPSAEGVIKLNDFNRAEPMLWDEDKQAFCRYRNGVGPGNYRAPEEYSDKPLDEKVDIYVLGLNMFLLLTGLWPDYDLAMEVDDAKFQERTRLGVTPNIDPIYRNRTYAETELVKLMEKCWAFDPKNRPDINAVISHLRNALSHLAREDGKT